MDLQAHPWEQHGAKVLRPHRARLAEARAVVVGAGDAAEAWAWLQARELVPGPAVAVEGGSVYRVAGRPEAVVWQPLASWNPRGDFQATAYPADIDDAVTLASDPEGIALAARYASRVAALLGAAEAPTVWVGVAPVTGAGPGDRGALDALRRRVVQTTGFVGLGASVWRRVRAAAPRTPLGALAAEDAACMAQGTERNVLPVGLPEALLGVWAAGYVLWSVAPTGAVLLAPRV